jgi:2,4-dienoyl-CoA reductase-like NADH-dependent reductase (Old Yellow Enzyme family)/thioredoxin reductase
MYYYLSKARGGVGLIVTSFSSVLPATSNSPPVAFQSDGIIPAYKKIADAIHQEGAKLMVQLALPGKYGTSDMFGGWIWSSSPLPANTTLRGIGEVPREMSPEEIHEAEQAFANAAWRAHEAGLDGVEINMAVGFLMSQFMSPAFNQRTDQYGGSLENRLRFPIETINAVRERVGSDFVVGIRLTGDEFLEGGIDLELARLNAQRLDATGKLDYISICAGTFFNPEAHIPPMYFPSGCFVYLAAAIKEVVSLPVMAVGRINDPVQAEKILADNQADMVIMNRATICDPEMPNKAREGRLDEIRKCTGCNEGCIGRWIQGLPITCSYNPEVGRELEFAITPAQVRKKVMVIGGGAAGLEAARVAALRGHQVSLYERGSELGGQLNIAAKAPMRLDFLEVPRFYKHQLKLLGVEVHLDTEVTPEMVEAEDPDAVVVATGSLPYLTPIPGADRENVVGVRQLLQEEAEAGQKVVVIAGEQHIQALSAADFLAEKGKTVELLTEGLYPGATLDAATLMVVLPRLLNKGVKISPSTGVKEITEDGLITFNVFTREERRIEGVDTVVIATDGRADDSLYRSLKGKVKELHAVGHCVSPRKMITSVLDGALVGRAL